MEVFVKGTCLTMCPKHEVEMRQRERLLHKLEMVAGTENDKYPKADTKKTIKCYSRSAADMKMAIPHILRPFKVLLQTVDYLTETIEKAEVSNLSKYNFICDRLRAVRQDMIIQALPPEQCIQLLQPMVLFHALYGYKLCNENIMDYDPVLNQKQLLECLKHVLICYDSLDETVSHLEVDQQLIKMQINSDEKREEKTKRSRIESIYILSNLNDTSPLIRYLKLPRRHRCQSLRRSYIIAVETMRGNFVRACRLARQLDQLELCSFSVHVPFLQRRALEVYSHAYHSKQLTFPSDVLAQCLLFNSSMHARQVCAHYGLRCHGAEVIFNKNDFQDGKLHPHNKLKICNELKCITTK